MTLRIALALSGVLLLVEAGLAQKPETETLPTPSAMPSEAVANPVPQLTSRAPVAPIVYDMPMYQPPWWVSGSYMLSWLRGRNLPPLVTTSPAGTPRELAGVIGAPGTTVLFGDEQLNGNLQSGGRMEVGNWFVDDFAWAAGWFIVQGQDNRFFATSNGTPILARPFIDTATGQFAAALIAFPGLYSGSIRINATADEFVGGHLNIRERFYTDENIRAEALIGYRFLHYGESININSSFTTNEPPAIPGTRLDVTDRFVTNNDFHGGDIGVRVEMVSNRLSLELLGKVAVGSLYRRIIIQGSTVTTAPGQDPVTAEGGLLALSSIIGNYRATDWIAVPEIGVTAGWQVNNRLRLTLGYTFLMFTQIARAGDQIDITVNQDLIPPEAADPDPLRPAFGLRTTDMWLQGLNLGLEYRF